MEKAWVVPDIYVPNRYAMVVHGAGMCDEYPVIAAKQDFAKAGYDGVLEETMVLCVESYIGADGGHQGVKLEQQVVITADGCRALSSYPWDDRLL